MRLLVIDLEIFGKLRNLQEEIKIFNPTVMPFDIDISDIPSIVEATLKGKLEDAKAMLADNLSISQIAKYTKLSIEQITELQENLKNKK
jgi:hypothetical protein